MHLSLLQVSRLVSSSLLADSHFQAHVYWGSISCYGTYRHLKLPKMKPRHLNYPLVVSCSIELKPLLKSGGTWVIFKTQSTPLFHFLLGWLLLLSVVLIMLMSVQSIQIKLVFIMKQYEYRAHLLGTFTCSLTRCMGICCLITTVQILAPK